MDGSKCAAWIYTFLLLINQFSMVAMETAQKKEYILNPEYLGLLYHRASSNVLLHGKAKRELAKLPKTEAILFDQCAAASKNVLQLAKCVSAVLDVRDRLKQYEAKPTDPECTPDESDGNWVMSLVRAIYRKWNCQNGVQDPLTNYEDKNNASATNIATNLENVNDTTRSPSRVITDGADRLQVIGTPNKDMITNRRRFYDTWRRNRLQIANLNSNDRNKLHKFQRRIPIKTAQPYQQTPDQQTHPRFDWLSQNRQKEVKTRKLGVFRSLQIAKLNEIKPKRLMKRDIRGISPRCLVPKNVETLRNVRSQFEKLNYVVKYLYDVTKSNQKFLEKADMKVEYRDRIPSKHSPLVQAREFAEKLESFEDRDIISILSPKLLNLMPETPDDPGSKRWLSPNMLSFQDEGMLPLPRLLQMSTSDHCETMAWLDLLIDMTGANRLFSEVGGMFGKFMNEVEETMYPRVKDVEVHDRKFDKIQELTSWIQQKQMDDHGYTTMSEEQMRLVYGKEGIIANPNETEFEQNEDFEHMFENEIRILGKMTEKEFLDAHKYFDQNAQKRPKRQAKNILDILLPMTSQPQVFGIRVLNPFAFTTRIRNANIMGPYILSPFAFYLQVVSPTLLHMDIISPRAFIASIFSPVVLTARVLAPSAFRLMLFSPLLLVVWVMVPEAFLAKIFAPKLLDARIMSPESFSFILLSPAAGVLRAASPNSMNFMVLSPSFGTYQLFSGNRYVVQVLSPGVLGVDSHPILREVVRPGERAAEAARQMTLLGQPAPQMNMIQTNQLQVNYGG